MITYRKLFAGALAIAAAVSVVSCGGNKTDNNLEFLPVKIDQGDNWSFLAPDGKIIYQDEFKDQPSPVINNFFYVWENNAYTVYKAGDRPEAVPGLEGLADCGFMSEGRIPAVRAGERIKYYDKSGKELFTLGPVDGKEIESVSVIFREGKASFCNEDGKYGYIDKDGNVVIKASYDVADAFRDGYATVMKDEIWRVIDREGKEVYKLKEGSFPVSISGDRLAVTKEERVEIVNLKNGESKKLPSKVNAIEWFDDKLIVFSSDGEDGLMTIEGETLIRARYRYLFPDGQGNFVALTDKKRGLVISQDGETLLDLGECIGIAPYGSMVRNYYGLSTGFEGVIYESSDSYSLFTSDEKSPRSYANIECNLTPLNEMVRSQYFNAASAAEKLASYFDGSAFGGVKLGDRPTSFLQGEPKDFAYRDYYTITDLTGGSKYLIDASAKDLDSYFAISEQIPDGYWYRTEYKFNPDSSIDLIEIDLTTLNDKCYDALRDALVPLLKQKGWSVESQEAPYVTMKRGNDHLIIMPRSDTGNGLEIKMVADKFWANNLSDYTSGAISHYSEFADPSAQSAIARARASAEKMSNEATSVLADSVAVDSAAVGDPAE